MEPRDRGRSERLEEDRVSGLPDELLHEILRRLQSSPAAARTSALSRRWRRVWASVPDLVLGDDLQIHHGASFLDAVDGALDSYAAAADPSSHLHGLEITVPFAGIHVDVPARRVAPWLRFAARCRAVALHLRINSCPIPPWAREELDLPLLETATSITLVLGSRFRLRPPLSGAFAALADLEIKLGAMETRALEVLVSTVTLVDASSGVSLRSATLQHLKFQASTGRLDIAAPALQVLDAYRHIADAYVEAPNLAEVVLGRCDRFVFADAGRHLRRLDVTMLTCTAIALLAARFDSIDELRLHGTFEGEEWWRFLDDHNLHLPKCETLWISSFGPKASVPCVLRRLLRRGNGVRKLRMLVLCLNGCLLLTILSMSLTTKRHGGRRHHP
ncbi:putative FBD-associated F-box protein At5g22720 isoform X2 [Brachypodium distachyon]|uniref:F-box domain-containing protein n=1 Tax=Brachypodium distachyon TaxID=15368 RepID=A0A0Q3MTF4_BRADI|nr:putative FBD-associated F-box protein At5g22720 isoform X2 [Brachypodium distachyon]KQK07622.1 hypothetical protein BRADI_2g36631v3 [Brachypodium distachyon]|eukprot:XP_014753923.1 putative FBD-associated F-box protein At5g22720 isoform X2 [Brachypodium distachyon]